jgi:hypothetical protein
VLPGLSLAFARQVTLLEPCTSQGCGSCPPAWRWLSGWIGDGWLWRELGPVALYVDYRYHPGRRDIFASPATAAGTLMQQGVLPLVPAPIFLNIPAASNRENES